MKKVIFVMAALLLFMGAESKAMVFGIRYTNTQEQPLKGLSGVADPATKGRFGLYAGQQSGNSTFLIGANYDRFKMNRADSLLYSRRLTVDIGYRYQLLSIEQAKAMSFMPFLGLHFFKSYSKVEADSAILSPKDAAYLKDISNDDGAWISIGAEYFFSPIFSLGAEGGLRYTRANSKAFGYDIHIREYNSFVAILLSFWLGQGGGGPKISPPTGD